jgi:two-component system, NarL family, response regulator LiaR
MSQNITLLQEVPTFSNILSSIFNAFAKFPTSPKDVRPIAFSKLENRRADVANPIKPILPNTLYLMCTSMDEDDELFHNLKTFTNGYIVKIDNSENIVAHIKDAIYDGALYSSGIDISIGNQSATTKKLETKMKELTAKENEILVALSKGLLYKEIAAQQHVMLDTIKKHCYNIYKKLEVANKTEAINRYLGLG